MNTRRITTLFLIVVALVLIDWSLGVLIVRQLLPAWAYLLANVPFGVVYVWTEAQAAGGQYEILGHPVRESVIGAAQLAAVYAQALLYYSIWVLWKGKRRRAGTLALEGAVLSQSRVYLAKPILGLAVLTFLLGSLGLTFIMMLSRATGGSLMSFQEVLSASFGFGITSAILWSLTGFSALMNSRTTRGFREAFSALPPDVKRGARRMI